MNPGFSTEIDLKVILQFFESYKLIKYYLQYHLLSHMDSFLRIFDRINAKLQEKSPYSFKGGSEISKFILFSFKL